MTKKDNNKKKMEVDGDGKKKRDKKKKNDREVSFSLRDIQNTFPKESEEETMVLAHIEEINPVVYNDNDNNNDNNNDDYGKTATSSLPVDFVYSMQESKRNQMMKEMEETKKPKSSQTDVTSSFSGSKGELTDDDDDDDEEEEDNNGGKVDDVEMGSRRLERGQQRPNLKPTTEEELYNYTSFIVSTHNLLDKKQNKSHMNKGGGDSDDINDDNNNEEKENDHDDEEEEQEPLTKEEKFAINAFGIFVGGNSGSDGNGDGDRDRDGRRGNGNNHSSIRQSFGDALNHVKFNFTDTFKYIRNGLCYLIIPGFILAVILFYGFWGGKYPPCTRGSESNILKSALQLAALTGTGIGIGDTDTTDTIQIPYDGNLTSSDILSLSASPSMSPTTTPAYRTKYTCIGPTYSWWVLFGIRQSITYSLAVGLQFLLIAYYQNHRSRYILFGPAGRLFVLQAKGMALTLIFWGILDFMLLYGNHPFAKHWLYFTQIDMFNNEKNPSGSPRSFTKSKLNRDMLLYMIFVGTAIALKRFTTGIQFGKASYSRYANRLSHVLKHISRIYKVTNGSTHGQKNSFVYNGTDEKSFNIAVKTSITDSMKNNDDIDSTKDNNLRHNGSSTNVSKTGLDSILDSIEGWEEIELTTKKNEDEVSLSALIQFGCSIKILDSFYPFSSAFGYCFDRCSVLQNSQRLYSELTIESSDNAPLHFRTLALAIMDKAGKLDEQELKDLIHVFRPNRDGTISMIDFCKSIDTVYKEIRKLRASIANESRMNAGAETVINCIFYLVLVLVALLVACDEAGDVFAIFGGLLAITLPFAFCFGGAAADYVKGISFILVQRPYDIGDRIAITGASESISGTGRPQWLVTDVSLHHTTLVYDKSQENATVANGAMAGMKILNGARSQNAQVSFTLLVDSNSVKDQRIKKFKDELFKYVKSKPRQWLKPVAFRMNTHEADDSGCLEYEFTLQHRESWQQIGAIKDSKSEIRKFCFDLKQSLGMDGSVEIPFNPDDIQVTATHSSWDQDIDNNGSDDDVSYDGENNEYDQKETNALRLLDGNRSYDGDKNECGKNETNPLLLIAGSTL